MSGQLTAEVTLDAEALEGFVEGVRGAVLRAGDPGYDDARAIWNGPFDRRPALIVQCTGAADVIDAVNVARDQNLLLSVKGGGPQRGRQRRQRRRPRDRPLPDERCPCRPVDPDGAGTGRRDLGRLRPGDAAVRTGGTRRRRLDDRDRRSDASRRRRSSTPEPRALNRQSAVGRHRTADGELRRASATENEGLFWAVRGAGSNFGVVTSFEFQAHPVGPMVMVGAVFYPLEDARSLLPAWRDYMAQAPEELSSVAICWSVPAHEPFPPELHGRPVLVVAAAYSGSVEDGEPVVQPLRELGEPVIDLSGPWPWLGLQSGFDELFPKGGLYYWKSRALAELSEAAIDEIAEFASRRPTPLTDIVIWHHGGAMSRVGETDTAYAGRDAPFLVTAEVTWTDRSQNDDAIAWGREAWEAFGRHSTGGLYLNFAGLGEEKEALVRAGYGANYDRLAALKAEYDPTKLFRMNLNITPAT